MKNVFCQPRIGYVIILLSVLACQQEPVVLRHQDKQNSQLRVAAIDYDSFRKNVVDQTMNKAYEVQGGTLHFKDPESFNNAAQDFDKFISKFNTEYPTFRSRSKVVDEVFKAIEAAKSLQETNVLVKKYNDFVSMEDSVLRAKINGPMASLLNVDGVIYIGRILYFYKDDVQYIVFNGDSKVPSDIKIGNYDSRIVQKIERTKKAKSARMSSVCFSLTGMFETYNQRRGLTNCQPNQVSSWSGTYDSNGQELYYDNGSVYTGGHTMKKNFWGNWYTYATDNELRMNYYVKAYYLSIGSTIVDKEPNYSVFNQNATGIENTEQVYSLTSTYSQVSDTYLYLEERAGYYRSPDLSGASVFYRCQ